MSSSRPTSPEIELICVQYHIIQSCVNFILLPTKLFTENGPKRTADHYILKNEFVHPIRRSETTVRVSTSSV